MRNRQASLLEGPNTRRLGLRIRDIAQADRLFCFKNSVHALDGHNHLPLKCEYERRILSIKYYDINLFAKMPVAIDDESFRGAITRRQIALQKLQPYRLARVPLRNRVSDGHSRSC